MQPATRHVSSWRFLLLNLVFVTNLAAAASSRARTSLNDGWRFKWFTSNPDSLSYSTLRAYMLPVANDFTSGTKFSRPSGTAPGSRLNYTQLAFDDSLWDGVTLPHDWAIQGPFRAPNVGTEMATLPSFGVGWYRRKITRLATEEGLSFLLDIDGAMSYAAVWLNGNLVGGWPFGYASFRLDLTPYMKTGGDNILAIRLDNPNDNSRWYPGGGLYRNVWLNKVNSTRVAQYGTHITTSSTSASFANVSLVVRLENSGAMSSSVDVSTEIRTWDPLTKQPGTAVATIPRNSVAVPANGRSSTAGSVTVTNPKMWGPSPSQKPNMYVAITTLSVGGSVVDTYQSPFGIRTITYDPNKGILVNGLAVRIQGTNNHHDLGSLGTAFNVRAAERQMEILQEMGCNALRTSHNPPAQEYLDLADQRGMLVLDEIFDAWTETRRTNDFANIFPDWREADIRLWVRRDRNHPSVIAWSIGNEVPEQGAPNIGSIASPMKEFVKSEDATRPVTASVNAVGPGALTNVLDIISLNYLGEGMGSSNYGSSYPSFRSAYNNKVMWSSESCAAISTRGVFFFPPASGVSASSGDQGGTSNNQISGYELYAAGFGNSADKTFLQQDKYSYVAGEFVWSGFDYLGEPHPLSSPRSSSFGIVDTAGFKKERFWLYQARWRPDYAMVHILPHWTWPDRVGQSVPIHVFSGADEIELFVNDVSQGRVKKSASSYRFRFDKVVYQPGSVRAVGYKNGQQWATETVRTVGSATKLQVTADRTSIAGDGYDLSFITAVVADKDGLTVPRSNNTITFTVSGPGVLVSTDNGNNMDFTAFPSATRNAFGGLLLGIVRANAGATGEIVVTASSPSLTAGSVTIKVG